MARPPAGRPWPLALPSDIADPGLASRARPASSGPTSRCRSCARSASASAASARSTGITVAACLHVTAETANLARALVAGGAEVALCAANPLSTQDDVAAALVELHGVEVHAVRGEDADAYAAHVAALVAREPHVTLDDGADLRQPACTWPPGPLRERMLGATEETTHRAAAPARAGGRGPARVPGAGGQRGVDRARRSTTASAPGSRRSTASCAPPTCCSPGARSWCSATAGRAGASRCAPRRRRVGDRLRGRSAGARWRRAWRASRSCPRWRRPSAATCSSP